MKIYLASGNEHKVQEFQAIADAAKAAGSVAVEFISAKAVGGMPVVVEDAGTFVGNARKKAAVLKAKLEAWASPDSKDAVWVLADDSGLCVDALGGAPGVESAYFAGPQGDSAANLRKLVEVMHDVPDKNRQAHFVCVLVLLGPDGASLKDGSDFAGGVDGASKIFEGRCDGTLLRKPRGGGGFGYDPLFVPAWEKESLAELGEALKNRISHRARAAAVLMRWIELS